MSTTITTDRWPGWAKALVIGQFAIVLAVLIPWILMWAACAMGMGMNTEQMRQLMETMPRR
jgi:hypothetical protein